MSIKKSLLPLAVLAFAMMGLASSAMAAEDGSLKDVTTGANPPLNHETSFSGFAKFETGGTGTECDSTAVLKATVANGTTGTTTFVPSTGSGCKSFGALAGCTVTSIEVTNTPYHVTVTPTDFDVTGNIILHNHYSGFLCPATVTIEFTEITLKPLKTGTDIITNTGNRLGTTAATGEPIAGVELSGTGSSSLGAVTASGKMEISTAADRDTYKL